MLPKLECRIEHVGKNRNGKPRFWCTAHGAGATGRYGAKLSECEGAYRYVDTRQALELGQDDFAGGVAVWGAVNPIYNTTGQELTPGIHVHARREVDGKKDIDDTYPALIVNYRRDLLGNGRAVITKETAVNYFLSQTLGIEVKHLLCTYCGEIHLDAGYYAVHPHRRHLCHGCGRYFNDDVRGVSNPIALIRHQIGDLQEKRQLIGAADALDVDQADYPGGLQVWASNPAILWTSPRPEEHGIHVHAFDADGQRVIDQTFSQVTIDGCELPQRQVALLMAQLSLSHLVGKVGCATCPTCGEAHFEDGPKAVNPQTRHHCAACSEDFRTSRMVTSNPLTAVLDKLEQSAPNRAR